jgi:hypothetical protein
VREINVSRAGDPVHAGDKVLTLFEIKIIASYSKMQEAHLYAMIYMPYIGISLV